MATTFVLIESQTLGSGGAASVTFSSIPQTFTDLKLVYSGRLSDIAGNIVDDVTIAFNGSTASFTMKRLFGDGSTTTSDSGGNAFNWVAPIPDNSATANTFGNAEVYIPNYAGSNNKSFSSDSVSENNATAAYASLSANLRSNTDAITSITLDGLSSNFLEYSTFYLYGIKST